MAALENRIDNKENSGYLSSTLLKLSGTAITTLLTIVITMTGFWMMIGRDYVTREEAEVMVSKENRVILTLIEERSNNEARLEKVLEKNTEAIQALKIQITVLNNTLEHIDDKK